MDRLSGSAAENGRIDAVMGKLYLGTSGFGYDEWKGPFYPPAIKQREMLPFYASRFPSVEINYTFRRLPSERTLAAWRAATPDGFQFALKTHQLITHWMRLAGADLAVSVMLERFRTLEGRLGPILFQCPPTLAFDRSLIESFLAYLPPTFRYAFEFRHPSWAEARDIIASQGAAWCVAETDDAPVTDDKLPAPSSPFVYLRLRKTQYSDDELSGWSRRVRPALDEGSDVFCFFKHEEKGAGPILAERMAALVGAA
jgi:uncharacterized protein YecE (DUF72 family)